MNYFIFNGDADGIFALHQYHLAHPCKNFRLITGVKRDIQLLRQLEQVAGCQLAVFDISLDRNRASLGRILAGDNRVVYFDHHFAGEIPDHSSLRCHIDPSAATCTSLLVNDYLGGAYQAWAICGAYGDNLQVRAEELGRQAGFDETQLGQLARLGELVNYNGYGRDLSDLHFPPAELYHSLQEYDNPFSYLRDSRVPQTLERGYKNDMAMAARVEPFSTTGSARIFLLPNEPWSRRVSGVFSNLKTREAPHLAHAVLSDNGDSTYMVSVRAPLSSPQDADTLCRQFPTGGGRAAAAGINRLPADSLTFFLQTLASTYGERSATETPKKSQT